MVPSCDSDDERRTLDRSVDMRAVRSLDTDAELAGRRGNALETNAL